MSTSSYHSYHSLVIVWFLSFVSGKIDGWFGKNSKISFSLVQLVYITRICSIQISRWEFSWMNMSISCTLDIRLVSRPQTVGFAVSIPTVLFSQSGPCWTMSTSVCPVIWEGFSKSFSSDRSTFPQSTERNPCSPVERERDREIRRRLSDFERCFIRKWVS